MSGVDVGILGPLQLTCGGQSVVLAGGKQRAVIAMLATHANQVVAVSALVDAVWGDPTPDRAEHTLQQHVSSVRKLLRDHGAPDEPLVTQSPGYLLRVDTSDAARFERFSADGFAAADGGRWADALSAFDSALALWRGAALADARDSSRLDALAVRLDEQRLGVMEMRFEARLECGQTHALVSELEQLVVQFPLRERLRAQLMLALYRTGRQAEALAAYQDARRVLIDELGIEPGPALRDIEQAILVQSSSLDARQSAVRDDIRATVRAGFTSDLGRIVFGDGQSVVLFEGMVVLGRDSASAICLQDSRVSRKHAHIEVTPQRCVVRDLGSTNGTTVNGNEVDERELADGDVIGLGGVEVTFRRDRPI